MQFTNSTNSKFYLSTRKLFNQNYCSNVYPVNFAVYFQTIKQFNKLHKLIDENISTAFPTDFTEISMRIDFFEEKSNTLYVSTKSD